MATKYTDNEMMSICAGRFIKDGDIVFAGTGVSMLAATAAKRIYAPKAVVFFETGGIDPALDEIPMAVSDLRVMYGTCLNSGLIEAFSIVGHRKLHTIAFLGAAQLSLIHISEPTRLLSISYAVFCLKKKKKNNNNK